MKHNKCPYYNEDCTKCNKKKVVDKSDQKTEDNSYDEVKVSRSWFIRLKALTENYEKNQTTENLNLLFGYISSAEFIIKKL